MIFATGILSLNLLQENESSVLIVFKKPILNNSITEFPYFLKQYLVLEADGVPFGFLSQPNRDASGFLTTEASICNLLLEEVCSGEGLTTLLLFLAESIWVLVVPAHEREAILATSIVSGQGVGLCIRKTNFSLHKMSNVTGSVIVFDNTIFIEFTKVNHLH